jgi:hypothetical protein
VNNWRRTYKPTASSRVQVFLAAAMWSVVGGSLLAYGITSMAAETGPGLAAAYAASGALLGIMKSRFVLDRAALKIASRIIDRGEGRCIGGFLSIRSWLLVCGMIALGRILRGGLLPVIAVGILYAAVGTALFFSSRHMWRSWKSAAPAGP